MRTAEVSLKGRVLATYEVPFGVCEIVRDFESKLSH